MKKVTLVIMTIQSDNTSTQVRRWQKTPDCSIREYLNFTVIRT